MATAPTSADTPRPVSRKRLAQGVGVVVFSSDEEVVLAVQRAVRARLPVYQATNIIKVIRVLRDNKPGVLVTDVAPDRETMRSMTAKLKEHLPELVTIAVAEDQADEDIVRLMNNGEIFRFLRKPLSSGRCAVSLQAALKHHRMLLKNPHLVVRDAPAAPADTAPPSGAGVMARLRSLGRRRGAA